MPRLALVQLAPEIPLTATDARRCSSIPRWRGPSDPERVGGLAVHRRVEAFFGLLADPDRRDQVDQLEHQVGEPERVGRAADAGGDLLAEEGGRAVHESLRAARVDRGAG